MEPESSSSYDMVLLLVSILLGGFYVSWAPESHSGYMTVMAQGMVASCLLLSALLVGSL